MQIQMEVTDIDECEYVEVDIVSARPKVEVVDLSGCSMKGTMYLLKQIVDEDAPFEYKYVYGDIGSTQIPSVDGYETQECIAWGLKRMHRKVVHRDRAWFESTKPWQDAFWVDVDRVKKGEELPQTPKKQKTCLIMDD